MVSRDFIENHKTDHTAKRSSQVVTASMFSYVHFFDATLEQKPHEGFLEFHLRSAHKEVKGHGRNYLISV